ncbi:MAG: PQQ-binding-like beta-propeller repeat protein, partial [Hyphomicrobiaceae bacterium]
MGARDSVIACDRSRPEGTDAVGRRLTGIAATAMISAVFVCMTLGLAGCSDSLSLPKINDLNPFLKKTPPLPGKRIAIIESTGSVAANLAPADRPIILPPPQVNDNWTQPGGAPGNAPGHLALNASIKRIWSADAGTGSSKGSKVTASPIVYDGRVYTLDAAARVSAFSVSGGALLWRANLVPESENKPGSFSLWSLGSSNAGGGYGGGLAVDGGRLYVATGFGTVSALDPTSGKVAWTKNLGAPIRSSPTAVVDRIFVTTAEGRIVALAGSDGSELWGTQGLPQQASLIGNASPAVDGEIVAAPFPSGEVLGLKIATGETVWTESLTRMRGATAISAMSDAARPAIADGVLYASAHGGRMVAARAATGERLWAINLSTTQPPWPVGEYVFIIDNAGQLQALNRRDGQTLWTVNLPGSKTWTGPTLAGGQLWLVSNKGALVSVDAATGRVTSQGAVGSPSYIAPVVAGGRMYVLTDDAKLIAYN